MHAILGIMVMTLSLCAERYAKVDVGSDLHGYYDAFLPNGLSFSQQVVPQV